MLLALPGIAPRGLARSGVDAAGQGYLSRRFRSRVLGTSGTAPRRGGGRRFGAKQAPVGIPWVGVATPMMRERDVFLHRVGPGCPVGHGRGMPASKLMSRAACMAERIAPHADYRVLSDGPGRRAKVA